MDKKVKPVAGPLPEDSKEQMEKTSKESGLRDSMSIRHQFIEETFGELKIGSDGHYWQRKLLVSKRC